MQPSAPSPDAPSGTPAPLLAVEIAEKLKAGDMNDWCDAAVEAIKGGGGFGWVEPPAREVLERYVRGVMAVPDRSLFIGRLDGTIAGSVQLVRPTRNNEAQQHAAQLLAFFVAPWARGHGLARLIVSTVEAKARAEGYRLLNMDVRETQEAAIALFESLGYTMWGEHPRYAEVNGRIVKGRYYFKDISLAGGPAAEAASTGNGAASGA
jgi:ribosomal protein S18 acetylase RimI-like enzyme